MTHFTLHTSRDGRLAFITVNAAGDDDVEAARALDLSEYGVPVLAFGEGVTFEVV